MSIPAPVSDAKTTQNCNITPIIVRIKNVMNTPMYVTGYDGTDLSPIAVPMLVAGNDTVTDVTLFHNGPHRWDWIYLGHDKDGHSLTIYFKQDDNGVLMTTIGTYKGRKEHPGELDPRYASAQPLFFDGLGHVIMQFNLLSYIAGPAKK